MIAYLRKEDLQPCDKFKYMKCYDVILYYADTLDKKHVVLNVF